MRKIDVLAGFCFVVIFSAMCFLAYRSTQFYMRDEMARFYGHVSCFFACLVFLGLATIKTFGKLTPDDPHSMHTMD